MSRRYHGDKLASCLETWCQRCTEYELKSTARKDDACVIVEGEERAYELYPLVWGYCFAMNPSSSMTGFGSNIVRRFPHK